MTLKTRLRLYLGLLVLAILSVSFFLLNLSLYFANERTTNNSLMAESNELIRTHLVVNQQQIFFRRDDQGNSLAAYLRDEDLSAIILDANKNVIAKYGILNDHPLPEPIDYHRITFNDTPYSVLVTPISNQKIQYGTLILIKTDYFLQSVLPNLIKISLIVIVVSLILSWFLGNHLLTQIINPLDDFVTQIKHNNLENLRLVKLKSKSPGEIESVATGFNLMVTQLNQDLKLQEQFISSASHEIKTPLSSAITTLDLASMDIADKQYASLDVRLKIIKNQLTSLSQLVSQLLTISSVKLKNMPDELIDIKRFISEIIVSHQTELLNKEINLEINFEPSLSYSFPKTHLYLIVDNLLSNAIKYNQKSGKITIEFTPNQFSISNSGPKISESELSRIFTRFYRAETTRHQHSGHGLGLSIVNDLCVLHHLKINVRSDDFQTVFTIDGFRGTI